MSGLYRSIIIPLPSEAPALAVFQQSLSVVQNWQFAVERFQSTRKGYVVDGLSTPQLKDLRSRSLDEWGTTGESR